MTLTIVSLNARPDLVPTVASWLWHEWGRRKGRTIEQMTARLTVRSAAAGFEETFARLNDDVPVATANLVNADLDNRPDLSPWLASVYVDPSFRGHGHAAAEFFDRDEAFKTALKVGDLNIGYLPYGAQIVRTSKINVNTKPNLSESFYIVNDLPPDDPRWRRGAVGDPVAPCLDSFPIRAGKARMGTRCDQP